MRIRRARVAPQRGVRRLITKACAGSASRESMVNCMQTDRGTPVVRQCQARFDGGCELEHRSDHLLAKEGVSIAPTRATPTACLQGLFLRVVAIEHRDRAPSMCRETSRVPASARQFQNVPVSYPRRIEISPTRATHHVHLQGFYTSPLTDSNRRPPPYHSTPRREARASAGHGGHENPANRRDRAKRNDRMWTRVPALMFPQCSLAAVPALTTARR
jgi:hypothetical protein